MDGVAREMRRRAEGWVWDGDPTRRDLNRLRQSARGYHEPTETDLQFARDSGHHSKGGYKSKACERCYHLALRFIAERQSEKGHADVELVGAKGELVAAWLKNFFEDNVALLWVESPVGTDFFSTVARWAANVRIREDMLFWHFRLFCDENWAPLAVTPREMSRDLRARGWVRFPELAVGKRVRLPLWPARFVRRLTG